MLSTSALALPISQDPVATAPLNASACNSKDSCIEAIMASARAGRHIEHLLLIGRMRSFDGSQAPQARKDAIRPNRGGEAIAVGNIDAILTTILRNAKSDYAAIPEYRRALALSYLKANQVPAAERELRDSIAGFPTHAPFWVDLAIAFSLQGKNDEAISALIVADTWAQDPKALRMAYEQAAQAASIKGMEQVYRGALDAIAANTAALDRIDAELPPIPASPTIPNKTKGVVPARVSFDKCAKPEWPRSSLRYEETGTVTLVFLVDTDGKLLRARKLESSGYVELDNAAFAGVSACTFHPALFDEKPTAGWLKLQYAWTLEN